MCTSGGATVVYVNGIFTSLTDAREDLKKLKTEYQKRTGDYNTNFTNGYNPSHIGGYGDLYKSIVQAYQSGESVVGDTDLTTILLQIHPQVTTQKVVLVGHSQGTYYTNDMYKYLTSHGVSQNSIAVYNIATPASFVAGDGHHLTSSTDKVINRVREALKHAPSVESFGAGAALATVAQTQPKDPLPSNTSFVLNPAEKADENGGHSFSNVYLENAPATIVSTINSDISGLSAVADFNGDCFVKPSDGVSYKTGKSTLVVMDFIAAKAGPSLAFARDFIADVGKKVPANFAASAGVFFSAITPTPRTTNLPGSHNIVSALYGSSVTEKNLREFGLLEDQGGAVVLAVQEEPVPIPETKTDTQDGVVLGADTETPAPPMPQALELPPMYSVGGGGSAGFGGGGGSSAGAEPAQEEAASENVETPAATTTETSSIFSLSGPPTIVSVMANSQQLGTGVPAFPYYNVVATTTSRWPVVITFNEDIQTPPVVVDGREYDDFAEGREQSVGDCGDSDAKTFCFTYTPTYVTEPGAFWKFRFTGALDTSYERLATTSYQFLVDTLGPTVTVNNLFAKTALPTIKGTTVDSAPGIIVQVLVNNILYQANPVGGNWSVVIPAEHVLAEGSYAVVASSTDLVGNPPGNVGNGTLVVDLTVPALTLPPAFDEGFLAASTSPVSVEYTVSDQNLASVLCAFDGELIFICSSNPFSKTLAPGAHNFDLIANDRAGNQTAILRHFVVE